MLILKKMVFVIEMKNYGKMRNAAFQHFHLLPQYFLKSTHRGCETLGLTFYQMTNLYTDPN